MCVIVCRNNDNNNHSILRGVKVMYKGDVDIDKIPREELKWLILQWVHDETGRRILVKWLLDGLTYERISEDLGISRSTVYKKAKKCSEQLFKHCPDTN